MATNDAQWGGKYEGTISEHSPQLDPRLRAIAARQPHPLLFVTLSGAHLYGFPSPDSDYDLRGVHVTPRPKVLGLEIPKETVELAGVYDGLELDLVTHDVRKFFLLLLKSNGYVLEQLYSPLIVHTTPEHDELKAIARGCITLRCSQHYQGFAESRWRLFEKERTRRVKPLLYVFRVLLTGIHLLRTGEIEANLVRLNEDFQLPYMPALIARKLAGPEQATFDDADFTFYATERARLEHVLEEAAASSSLSERRSPPHAPRSTTCCCACV